jgi:hypothetical protein
MKCRILLVCRKQADPLWGGMASGNLCANVQYLGDGILKATGVHSAAISHVENIVFTNSSNSEIIEGIRRPVPPGIMHRLCPGGSALFDAYCHTLCADNFRNPVLASSPALPRSARAQRRSALYPRGRGGKRNTRWRCFQVPRFRLEFLQGPILFYYC